MLHLMKEKVLLIMSRSQVSQRGDHLLYLSNICIPIIDNHTLHGSFIVNECNIPNINESIGDLMYWNNILLSIFVFCDLNVLSSI